MNYATQSPRLPPRRTMRQIAEAVAAEHNLTLAELKAPTCAIRFSHPRQEAMTLMRAELRPDGRTPAYSYMQIARFFGMTDHTTVIGACRSVLARAARSSNRPRTSPIPLDVWTCNGPGGGGV